MHGRASFKRWLPLAILALLALSLFPAGLRSVYGFTSGQNAALAVGEPDLYTSVNPSNAFKIPSNIAFDSAGNLWISDAGNNRVIEEPNPVPGGSTLFLNVLGQPGYSSGLPTTTQTGLSNPSGLVTDSSGNLWVADTNNNRVLEYPHPFSVGEASTTVIGQQGFSSAVTSSAANGLSLPGDVLFDSAGNMWVVDTGNNRVLEYAAPFTTGMSASLVIGQGNLTGSAAGVSSSSLYYPTDAVFDSAGNLWLADSGNSRVLEFNAPFSTGMAASLVIGQPSLATGAQQTTQGGMSFPDGVAFDASGNLWVADAFNNRLLEFAPPFASGGNVYWEIGQSGYTSSLLQGAQGLFAPESVAVDSSGNLWAADTQNNRVVEYSQPLSTGMSASVVLGESNLTRSLATTTGSGLSYPYQVLLDSSGNLWVSDAGNNRILEYTAPFKTGMNASLVIGQLSFATSIAQTSSGELYSPSGMAFDAFGDLWVSDTGNSRILEFKPPFTTGMSASLVIGQTSFAAYLPGTSSSQLDGPIGLSFDHSGNLWVADAFNNRVLGFASPFTTGEAASLVIGQSLFTSTLAVTTQTGLSLPSSVGFDRSGDLWVSDSGNDRVLEYTPRFSTGMAASLVIGQTGFGTGTGSTSPSGLSNPLGLVFDSSGNLWLADSGNNRLLEFQGTGGSSTTTSGSSTTTSKTSTTSTNGIETISVSSTSSSSTQSTSTTTASSSHSTTSTVPEFPLGAPVVLASAMLAVATLMSARKRMKPRKD